MMKISALLAVLLMVQACTTTAPDEAIFLPLEDGRIHRLGLETGLVDADRMVLSDGNVSIPVDELVPDFDLEQWRYVDLVPHRIDNDGWYIGITPDKNASHVGRTHKVCAGWTIVVEYSGGTTNTRAFCSYWVFVE